MRLTPRFGLSGIHGSSREYRVCIYYGGGGISCLLFVIGPWILCWITPTNHGPFADLLAKSFKRNKNWAVKSERSPFNTADDLTLFSEPLQNRIEEGQRILHSGEVVSPTQKRIADIDSTHLPSGSVIDYGAHEVGPCELSLYLLTKGILKPDLGSLQLCDFCIERVALKNLSGDLSSDFLKSFLEVVCHGYSTKNTQNVYK